MTSISRVGDFSLMWGESVRWDDERQRLSFVDCGRQTLHWLDGGEPPLRTMPLPGLPTGVVLTDDGALVVALDDGLHIVDPDAGTTHLLTAYPEGLGGRANDANADLDGNLVTGTLNLGQGPGSAWWFSAGEGWRQLADGITNVNGPVVVDHGGRPTLVVADSPAGLLYAFDYDGKAGTATDRRTFADTTRDGQPDGACADGESAVWSAILGAGHVARYTAHGLDRTIATGVELPSDVTFGGPGLDRMYVVSIAVPVGGVEIRSPDAGGVLVIDDTGVVGRPEPRFRVQR